VQDTVLHDNIIDEATAVRVAEHVQAVFSDRAFELSSVQSSDRTEHLDLVADLTDAPQRPLKSCSDPVTCFAFDGGSAVLAKGGDAELIAWRTGFAEFHDTRRVEEYASPLEFLGYSRKKSAAMFIEYAGPDAEAIAGDMSISRLVDELRSYAEWKLLSQCIDTAPEGSLLLLDGTLQRQALLTENFQRRLFQRAGERGVQIAGVSKRTNLVINGTLLACDRGYHDGSCREMWYRLISKTLSAANINKLIPEVYLAKFNPDAEYPLRVDISRFNNRPPEQVLAMIASLSDDVEFPGYPYPLVHVHRLARIDPLLKQGIISRVGEVLEEESFPPELWSWLTKDIHEKLNSDIPTVAYV
jgi:hypothetical protein